MDKQTLLTSLHETINSYCQEYLTSRFDRHDPIVRLHEPTYGADEIWEALDSLLSTMVTMGDKVKWFECEFADYFGFANSIMVNSGSSANLLAVASLSNPAVRDRFRPGDEVIVPALSWSTTVWPLVQHGLVPVIVDIDPLTLNVEPDQIERAITQKTRGIMLVHVYGNPCDMAAIMDIVDRHSLMLIEDCCEAIGAFYKGQSVGSFGRVSSFSFYFSHHITTLEGGMCVTGDDELAELLRILRAHGWIRETRHPDTHINAHPNLHPRFLFVNQGYNLRATELQGGFGVQQLKKLQPFIDIRTDNARYWSKRLGRFADFFQFQQETPGGVHSWFGFPMVVKKSAPFSVREFTEFLNQRGIETRPIIAGNIASQPGIQYYEHRVVGDLSASDHVMMSGFTFGNHQAIDEEVRDYVVEMVESFMVERGLA